MAHRRSTRLAGRPLPAPCSATAHWRSMSRNTVSGRRNSAADRLIIKLTTFSTTGITDNISPANNWHTSAYEIKMLVKTATQNSRAVLFWTALTLGFCWTSQFSVLIAGYAGSWVSKLGLTRITLWVLTHLLLQQDFFQTIKALKEAKLWVAVQKANVYSYKVL